MRQRRCAVPATSYYEWERTGKSRVKYAIHPQRPGLFYMAGLYRLEPQGPAFTILTRAPAEAIAFIHDRMPVILPPELVQDWIDPRHDPAAILARAVLSVACERQAGNEQLAMEF